MSSKHIPIFSLLILTLVAFALLGSIVCSAQVPLSLRLSFDKPFYGSGEEFTITLTLNNDSPTPVKEVRVTLSIDGRLSLPNQTQSSSEQESKPLLRQTWSRSSLPAGKTEFKIKKEIPDLEDGAYQVLATVTQEGQTILEQKSALCVMSPKISSPLLMAIVWNLHDRAHFNPQRIFLDQDIQDHCSLDPQNPEPYFQHIIALSQHPNIRVNMNFTPLLLQQIQDVSDGYEILVGGKVKKIPEESKQAQDATELLKRFEKAVKNGQIELIPAPYAYPSLATLANQGWDRDGLVQIKKGKEVVANIFNLPEPAGLYPPNLTLNSKALSYLTQNQVKYTILKGNIFLTVPETEGDIYMPHRVQDAENNRLTVFFADDFLTQILTEGQDAEATSQRLLGALTEIYLTRAGEQKIAVMSPDDVSWDPNLELLQALYAKLEQIPWVKTITLGEAADLIAPPTKPLTLAETELEGGYLETEYLKELERAQAGFELFSEIASPDHPLQERFLQDLLIAQSSDWLGTEKDPKLINLGLSFAADIERNIDFELAKITMPRSQVITLTGQGGKVPITINNATGYPISISIALEGEDFFFPSGDTKNVTLSPEENVFTFPVTAKRAGSSLIKVTIKCSERKVAESMITVKSTYFNRVALSIVAVLMLITCVILGWRYFKTR